MSLQSFFKQTGLNISVYKPTLSPVGSNYVYDPRGTLIEEALEDSVSSYEHEIDGEVGFKSARISIGGSQEYIEGWIENGLNLHVEVHNRGHETVWEGFVNSLAADLGALQFTRGGVLDIFNRVTATYTPIDYTSSPPSRGPQTETAIANDTTSQVKYGILEGLLNASADTQEAAELARDTQLASYSMPGESTRASTSGGAPASVTLNLAGYGRRAEKYIYNDTATGYIAISDKIIAALGADPNGLFSVNYNYITSNPVLVAAEEGDNRMAMTVIKALIEAGTANDKRTFFGIYENRIARYWNEPTDITYRFRIADVMQDVERGPGGAFTAPWDLRPGYWVFYSDFLSGRVPPPIDLRTDPRVALIESVKFTAPYNVEFNGQNFGSIEQLLAKRGLGGM